jgi:protein-S-isoprenylcysteine O-methyltransferase Ste14
MIAWINFAVLVLSSLFFLLYCVRSVSPAAREMVIGPRAYPLCARDRVIAMLFMFVTIVCYVVYYFYPLPVPLPQAFPWAWWISLVIALMIGMPTIILMVWGLIDAGEEAARPKKEHTMYGGIYRKIRHPQAAGEVFLWLPIAFLLHSPFLVIFSLVYFPIFLIMCIAEENDLLLRYGEPYAEYCRQVGAFWPKRKSKGNL